MAANNEVTTKTLEDTPRRALEFMMGVASSAGIFNILQNHGYSTDEQLKGWKLLQECGTPLFDESELGMRTPAADALGQLDNLDEKLFRLVRATLENGFTDQLAQVLSGIGAASGPMVVLHVSRLLERLNALESSQKDDDRKAMAKLAIRGITKSERERLAQLVEQARSVPSVKTPDNKKEMAREEQYLNSLKKLRNWHLEWSEVARATIQRREYLIRLGLANRRERTSGQEPEITPQEG